MCSLNCPVPPMGAVIQKGGKTLVLHRQLTSTSLVNISGSKADGKGLFKSVHPVPHRQANSPFSRPIYPWAGYPPS